MVFRQYMKLKPAAGKGHKIHLPALLKFTNEHIISCLFIPYKNQSVKTAICIWIELS